MEFPTRLHVPATDGGPPVALAADDLSELLAFVRNKGFDQLVMCGEIGDDLARAAAAVLHMTAAHADTGGLPEDADAAVDRCDPAALKEAVCAALYGEPMPPTYDAWVWANFRANGLDPRAYHPAERAAILRAWRETGRATDPGDWIDSVAAMRAWEGRHKRA